MRPSTTCATDCCTPAAIIIMGAGPAIITGRTITMAECITGACIMAACIMAAAATRTTAGSGTSWRETPLIAFSANVS